METMSKCSHPYIVSEQSSFWICNVCHETLKWYDIEIGPRRVQWFTEHSSYYIYYNQGNMFGEFIQSPFNANHD